MSTQEFNCDTCKMTLNCYQQYMQHKTGRKHLNKAKQMGMNPDAGGTEVADPSQPKAYGGTFVPASVSDVEGLLNGKQSQGAPQTVVPFNEGFNSNTLAQIAGQGNGNNAPVSKKQDPVAEAIRQNLLGTLPVKRKAEIIGVCEPCGLEFNSSDQQQAHLNGKKHAKKMKLTDIAPKQDPVAEAVRQNMLGTLPVKRKAVIIGVCEPCGLEFNSQDQQQAHLSGKKHAKKMKLSDTSNAASFFCSFCNLQLNSIDQMEQHREGTKHKKKVGNAKNVQDEMRLASKLPKIKTEDLTASPPPPPPVTIPPPPAKLESMKYEIKYENY